MVILWIILLVILGVIANYGPDYIENQGTGNR